MTDYFIRLETSKGPLIIRARAICSISKTPEVVEANVYSIHTVDGLELRISEDNYKQLLRCLPEAVQPL